MLTWESIAMSVSLSNSVESDGLALLLQSEYKRLIDAIEHYNTDFKMVDQLGWYMATYLLGAVNHSRHW